MKLRLALSPAGLLHVGNARIALANFLLARRHGARLALRLDDAAALAAAPPDSVAAAIGHDLRWLGLEWDEQVAQSERLERYRAAAERLKQSGRLYPCFESEEELSAKRDQRQRRGQPPLYDRAMLKMTPQQRARAEAGGKRPYWRFLLSGTAAAWDDQVLGRCAVKLSAVSDPVVIRADGTPLHALTSAVDELEMGITHAVRGEDHVTGTGIQMDIMAALGGAGPRWAHLPLLLDAKGGRLGPHAAPTLRTLRADGVEPASLAGLLASLGTGVPPSAEPPGLLAPRYELGRIRRTAPRFDPADLLALNRRTLATLPFEAVQPRLPEAATPAFWNAVRGHLDLLREARGWWDVIAGTIVPPVVDGEGAFLRQAIALLPPEPWDEATGTAWIEALHHATSRPAPSLLPPLRLALTGEDSGPDLPTLLPLIGRTRTLDRLRMAAS